MSYDPSRRRAARRHRRAQLRRRRMAAVVLLTAGLALVVFAVVQVRGGHGGHRSARAARHATRGRSRGGSTSLAGAHKAPNEAVPILMYHLINAPPAGTAEPELWVPRRDFAAQMNWLAGHGYHAVTLQTVWDAWHHGGLLPSRPIVVSFDDGYHSQYSNALPILRSHRWPGVLNLQVNQTRQDLKPPEVRQMIAAGWEVDAHTITHPDLTTVDATRLREEVAGSRTQLRRTFGVPVNFFCYPAGRFDQTVVAAVRAAGYLAATTTQPGLARPTSSPYQLARVRVNGTDGVSGLAADLAGARSAGM